MYSKFCLFFFNHNLVQLTLKLTSAPVTSIFHSFAARSLLPYTRLLGKTNTDVVPCSVYGLNYGLDDPGFLSR